MNFNIEKNKDLKGFTSWLVGGPAEHYIAPKTTEELELAYRWGLEKFGTNGVHLLAGGTNVLISDRGVSGLTIHLRWYSGIVSETEEDGCLKLVALAGTPKSELLKVFLKRQLAPALFLAGLPGDVGGGVVMNAGVSEAVVPREFGEIVEWIEVIRDQGTSRLPHDQLKWSYRHCHGWDPGIISKVKVRWPLAPREPDLLERVRAANKTRMQKQPLDWPSCGSVFVNPLGHKAGQLIESSGLKGYRIGGAEVSKKHANFVINLGGATALDIHQVIVHVQREVQRIHGIELKTEVVYLGNW